MVRKLFLIWIVATLCFGQASDCGAARSHRDYLVPVKKALGSRAAYEELWQKKLLVTPGEIARFVGLPGTAEVETTISVYQAPGKEGSLSGDYWVTATQASERLWNCVEPGAKQSVDPDTIAVERCDAPIPESTALAMHKTWLAMLSQSRPQRNSREIPVDSSREIFSAVDSEGRVLQGENPTAPKENTKALINIALSLLQYCGADTPERAAIVTDIEKAASDLLGRVASNSRNGSEVRNPERVRDRKKMSHASNSAPTRTLAAISNAPKRPPNDLALGNPPPQYQIVIKDNPAETRFDLTLISADDRPLCVSGGGWPDGLGHVDWGSSWVKLSSKSRIFPARDWDFGYCEGKDCSHRVGPKGTLTGFIGYAEFGDPKEISALPDRRLLFETSAYVCPHEQAQRSEFSSSPRARTVAGIHHDADQLPAAVAMIGVANTGSKQQPIQFLLSVSKERPNSGFLALQLILLNTSRVLQDLSKAGKINVTCKIGTPTLYVPGQYIGITRSLEPEIAALKLKPGKWVAQEIALQPELSAKEIAEISASCEIGGVVYKSNTIYLSEVGKR